MAKSYSSIKSGWINPKIDSSTGTIKKKKYNEIKSSDYDFGVDESYVNSFLNRSSNYFKNAENDSKDVNYNNASSLDSNYRSALGTLKDEADNIRAYYNANKNKIDTDSYNLMIGYLDSFDSNSSNIQRFYSKNADFYSQWETEEDYIKAVESQKNREDMLSFDLEVGKKGLENLKEIQEKARNASKGKTNLSYDEYYYSYKRAGYGDEKAKELANNAVNSNNEINSNIDAEIAGYLEGTGYKSLQELDDAIAQKTAYYNRSKILQENEKFKTDAINASDFKEYSQKGDDIVNPSQKEAEGWFNIGDFHVGGADVGNIVTYSRDNYEGIRMGSHMVGNAKYHYMTNDEVSVYNYYLAKENEGKVNKGTAQQYLDSLEDTLNQREAGEVFENSLKDNTPLELVFGVNAGLDQFRSGIKNLFNTEDDYIAPSSTQYTSQMVREDLADDGFKILGNSIGQTAYDFITTTSNMFPSIAASTIVGIINPVAGQAVGAGFMGASASGNAYQEMLNLGYDKSQARVYSALTGASEAGLQYVLGGVGKLGGKLSGNLAGKLGEKIASQINNAYARFAVQHGAKFIAEMGSEGLEEFLQDVLNPYFKSIATGESPESIDWEQAIYSGLLGALSAGSMNSISAVSNRVSGLSNANQIIKDGNVGTIKEIGSTYNPESLAYEMAQGLTDKTGRWKLADTLTALQEELGSQNKADIKNALVKKGIDESQAERYSKLFEKALNGGTLTKSQQKEIFENSDLTHVLKTLQSKDSVISKRNQNFGEVGVKAGSLGTDFESIYKSQKNENLTERINLEAELKQLATENVKRKFGVGRTVSRETDAMLDSMVDDAVKQYGAKATNKIAKAEASIQNDGKVSETGKTILISTGEEVNIKKINSINPEKKELTFELGNGKIVSNRDIQYANSNVALAYESMVDLGYDLDTANAMVQILSTNSVKPNNQLLLGLNKAYEYGWGHIPESVRTDADFNALTETQKSAALKLGEDARLADDMARIKRIPDAQKRVAKKNNGKEFSAKLDADIKHIPGRAKVSVKALDEIAKKLQINFIVKDLKGVSNGWYSGKENAIVIDINAGTNGANTLLWTASHELVHYFRRWSPSEFTALADFLMQRYAENGKNIDELIAIEQDKAFKATKGKDIMSFDTAYEEVVAQAMQEFLTDSNFITELSTLQKSNPGLAQKIIDTLRKIFENIREWYNGLTPSDKATEYVKEMGEAANEMYDMLSKGLFKASETSMAKVDNTASVKETKTETAVMQNEAIQSVADVATDTDGNKLLQYKAMEADEKLKLSEDTENALSESVNGISKVNILSSSQDSYSIISEDMESIARDITQELGTSDESLVEAEFSDVVNTFGIKNQYKNGDETYSKIGKEMLGYQEGNRKPDFTLVEVYNDRTGKTETTIKFVGDKPKGYVPKKIAYCYKLFEQHPDGTLHALFAGASNATPIGEWVYAQGFPYTDSGVKEMNLRERYGWHLSAGLPSAPHLMSTKDFNRGYPSKRAYGHPKGSKRVWVRMAYDASTDFNSIADSTKAGDIFGLIPFGGYYAFKENNQSEWVISSAVKIDKILNEEERQQILKDAGYDEYEAWRKKHRATEAEKLENKRMYAENKKAKDKAIKAGLNYLSENSKAMRESIKSRIIDNPELTDVKHQYKVTAEQDAEYLELAKNPEKSEARLRELVEEVARNAGYNSPKLYHGTEMFGFTKIKTSGVEKGVEWSPFFATNKEDISASYVPFGKVRDTYSSMDDDAIEEARESIIEERKENISDLVYEFRRLIDRHISEWVFGQTNNSYLEKLVEEANPEPGSGDGVYDVLSEVVFNSFYDYQDELGEYEDADDWAENSPEGNEIFSKIVEIESEKSALHSLESGEELGGIYQLYANLDNMYAVDGKGVAWNELRPDGLPKIDRYGAKDVPYKTRDVAKWARENGFDGVIFKNIRDNGAYGRTPAGDVYVFFRPESQVKSADLVTYDGNGNIIPLSERFRTDRTGEDAWRNDDIRYQYRDLDATDNRTLLANALASTAQNEIEKKYIEQYQSKIDTINAEQQKLTELRAKIKELSFAKGNRDTKQIRKLQDEATKTANRINTFDKQLLRLESAKPLKEVLNREKALAKKKAEKAGREALDAYKERAAKTQRELMDRYQERIKKGKEGRDKTALRHKIIKKVKELNNLLLKGDKDHHVPIALQKSTALALQAINMDTVNADERIAKIREKIAKSNNPEQIEKWQKSIDRIELQGENMMAKLDALDRAYEDIKNSNDPLIANVYDDGIKQAIVNLKNEVGDTPLREMSLSQLESVYDMYKMVLHTIRNVNKAFKAEKQETITELGNNVMQEVESVGGKKKYTIKALDFVKKFYWLNLKPVYAIRSIGSKTLAKLFDNVRAGEDTWAVDVNEAREYFRDIAKKYNYNSWDFDQRYTFKSNTGKEFSLSLQDIMSLYAYSKREQADRHLTMGGFVFDDAAEIIEKKKGIPVKYKVNISDAHNISMHTLSEIINTLTPEQMAFVNEMQKYLADDMGAKGNEVSRAMYDIDLFKDKNYFPLKSAKQFMFEQNEVAGEVRIKNSGFTKSTVPNANNPIILKGFMDVWSEHVSDMAMYHSFVLPLEDFNRVWNYKTPTAENLDTESVKMVLQNAYGRQANDYIKQMLTDINGGARSQQGTEITNKLISLFKKGAVFASASVVIQQPSAIARAMAYIDAKYFAKATPSAWNLKSHNADWAEVKKYAPVAIIKEMGYFDTNMGKQTTDWITSTEYEGFGEKAKALVTDSGFRDEMLSKAPALADEIAWVHIWNAVKKEVADTNKALGVGSEDFLKECGKRFTEVVVNTQVYDSVLSRSALMRSKDTGVKMATAFMAEATTSINMITDALIQGKRGDKKFARKAIGAVVSQMILNSILVSLVYAGRDDDEDKTYAEKYIGTLVGTTLDSINPLSLIPYVRDIVSIVQGYDVERSDMAVISALWNAYQNLGKDSISPYKKVENFAGAIANIFGLPLKNIMRDARACYNIVNSYINGNETTAEGIKRSIVEEITGDDANKQIKNELIDAMESGDSAKIKESIQDMFDSGKEKSAIQSILTSYWKPLFLEAYKKNDNAEMAKIRKALNATGIYKDVVKTTQDWIKKSKSE